MNRWNVISRVGNAGDNMPTGDTSLDALTSSANARGSHYFSFTTRFVKWTFPGPVPIVSTAHRETSFT